MTTIYWENFQAGEVLDMGSHVFSEKEIIEFAQQYDPQPIHLDAEASSQSVYGGLIASGWHTCAVGMRFSCTAYINKAVSMGSPGLENIRWLKPVRPGDTIAYRIHVLETRASKSRPDAGLVRTRMEAVNQEGAQVLTMEGWGMFGRKPPTT